MRDSQLAFPNLCLIGLIKFHRLLEREQMLLSIVAHERLGNRRSGTPATVVTMLCQDVRITLASNNRFDDLHSRHTCDVCDHVMQQEIHLLQRLLHVLDVHR